MRNEGCAVPYDGLTRRQFLIKAGDVAAEVAAFAALGNLALGATALTPLADGSTPPGGSPGIALAALLAGETAALESPLHKRVAVRYDRLPLADVLRDLGGKAGVRFAYPDTLLANTDSVTYEAKDQEAGRVATRVLRPRGLRLGKIEGDVVEVARLDPLDEFKVKREEVYEFTEKPKVVRDGDKLTIAFASKAFCDATVAIEDANGRIVRHLASGVLGENAPEPLQWNSRRQAIAWDGKDDRGRLLDDKDRLRDVTDQPGNLTSPPA